MEPFRIDIDGKINVVVDPVFEDDELSLKISYDDADLEKTGWTKDELHKIINKILEKNNL